MALGTLGSTILRIARCVLEACKDIRNGSLAIRVKHFDSVETGFLRDAVRFRANRASGVGAVAIAVGLVLFVREVNKEGCAWPGQ
tara:strand:- start:5850 stop:6104 length:255 start_codon:yes stop_codon:yes gene_type:complete